MKLFHTYSIVLCLTFFSAGHANAFSPTAPLMKDYKKTPTFMSESEKPSTMLILDSSGSMRNRAYRSGSDSNFQPTKAYYGYFDNTAYYSWNNANNYFQKCVGPAATTCSQANAPWSGNFMNWLSMRRVDVAKKVLTGGRVSTTPADPTILIAHPSVDRDLNKWYNDSTAVVDINGNTRHTTPYSQGFTANFSGNGTNQTMSLSGTGFSENVRIKVHPDDIVNGSVEGVIQKNGDDIRFGLTIFDTWDGDTIEDGTSDIAYNGGEVQAYIGAPTSEIVQRINSTPANSWTPLAETLYTVAGLYAQDKNATISSTADQPNGPRYATDSYSIGNANDPFYFANKSKLVPCSKPFVILITDGEPTQDTFIPATIRSAGTSSPWNHGGGYLENVAYWAHTTDLRPDLYDDGEDSPDDNDDGDLTNDDDDDQNLILYTVYAFGSGTLLRSAAINGSFVDKGTKNGLPNSQTDEDNATLENKEWDFNDDGEPDNYAAASDGTKLEKALSKAMNDILRATSSGTASSVISSSRRGEGAAFQAVFMPEYLDQSDHTVQWIGDLNAMFKDNNGNLREDRGTNGALPGDGILNYKDDRVARIFYSEGKARVNLYIDADGDGDLEFAEDIDDTNGDGIPDGDGHCDHNEDLDYDGNLDVFEDTFIRNGRLDSEDIDCDGVLDRTEDINGNGVMDPGEDIDHDGNFDNVNEDHDHDCVLNTIPEDIDGPDVDGDGVPDGDGYLDRIEDLDNDGNFDIGEDINGNGILDPGEDIDEDGNLDLNEDLDNDGHFDLSEDVDGDGILDRDEDAYGDGDGILDLVDEDLDGDGYLDPGTESDLNGDGHLDIFEDLDGDGNLDVIEDLDGDGYLDPGTESDLNGDGHLDIFEDLNGDGNLDIYEDADNDGHLDVIDEDINNNGILDPGEDLDGDGHLDDGTEDHDGDGVLDLVNEDHDGDGVLDLVNEDFDGDGNLDNVNEDVDGDGVLDTVNEDHDGDGILDLVNEDFDGDGNLDNVNEDLNNDGNLDINEDYDGDLLLGTVNEDLDGDGHLDVSEDIDGDGHFDNLNEDYDHDGLMGTVDEDTDGDGIMDINEDIDGDGYLDNGEDVNCNGTIETEDVDGDCRLDLKNEDVDGDGRLDYEEDLDQDGVCDVDEATVDNTVDLLNMHFLWSAGKNLGILTPAETVSRKIITSFDSNGDGWVTPGDVKYFTTASIGSVTNIYTYFNLPLTDPANATAPENTFDYDNDNDTTEDPEDLAMLINYIRGVDDNDAFRSREIWLDLNQDLTDETQCTWRLGDIVNSSPISVQKPMENFDLLYNDDSYRIFSKKYLKRRHVLYVGSNDGMLRAINGGFYDKNNKQVWRNLRADYNPYDGSTANDTEFDNPATSPKLGDELWAYLPYNLLPHLSWLARKDYEHVYYVDKQVRVADVKIFNQEAACGTAATPTYNAAGCIHPQGWGTILIGGMRFGGGPISVDSNDDGTIDNTDDVLGSSYFVLDITNPEAEPDFLGEFAFDNFSFTTSTPTIIQMKNSASTNGMDWYITFGTGPTTLKGQSDQKGKIYILKLNNDPVTNSLGTWVKSPAAIALGEDWFGQLLEEDSFLSDMISVDFEIGPSSASNPSFMDDAIYFGSTSGGWYENVAEDLNGNGTLDLGEDLNCNGVLDAGEDLNGDTVLTPSEDVDCDGILDVLDDFDGDGVRDLGWSGALYRIILDDYTNSNNWIFGADTGSGLSKNSEPFLNVGAPITAAPAIATNYVSILDDAALGPYHNVWVYAGTGRYFDELDDTDEDSQYIIGVMEPNSSGKPIHPIGGSVAISDLLDVTNSKIYKGNTPEEAWVRGVAGISNFQQLIDSMVNDGGSGHNRGWIRELDQSLTERIITAPLVFGGGLFVNSYAPNREICSAGGDSWSYGLYYLTGTAYYKSILGDLADPHSPNGERLNIDFLPKTSGKGGGIVIDDPGGEGGTHINVQSSTGAIEQIETETPINTDSGKLFWKNEF